MPSRNVATCRNAGTSARAGSRASATGGVKLSRFSMFNWRVPDPLPGAVHALSG